MNEIPNPGEKIIVRFTCVNCYATLHCEREFWHPPMQFWEAGWTELTIGYKTGPIHICHRCQGKVTVKQLREKRNRYER